MLSHNARGWFKHTMPLTTVFLLVASLILNGCEFGTDQSHQQHLEITFDLHPQKELMVISAAGAGGRDLYLVDLLTLQAQRLTRTENLDETTPRFSPDGKQIVYAARSVGEETNKAWNRFMVSLETVQEPEWGIIGT